MFVTECFRLAGVGFHLGTAQALAPSLGLFFKPVETAALSAERFRKSIDTIVTGVFHPQI